MEYYSNDPNADRINRLKGEMSQVSLKCFSSNMIEYLRGSAFQSVYVCFEELLSTLGFLFFGNAFGPLLLDEPIELRDFIE